ncbi:hypothetical protein BJ322DRAFT_1222255 [Thelephora terrestris]|uniref:Nephrocystin 3-like N-terminal domain-containing protein n=1 Tax=Thelephora terrestris TaxID=56493 RepID=A0A9P6H1J3_9AGAM|nr:hypothetical protein BJ322DRAFT_1222255 [Thelephora terrestris]
MVQQMAMYDQGCKLIDAAERTTLNNFRQAQGAEYRHVGRKRCLKGTRRAVLDEIELWARDFAKLPVYWLNGLAGTGKSTIAQTIAERMFAEGQLGASFFCSRGFEDRSNLHFIFPTLAVQLARTYPSSDQFLSRWDEEPASAILSVLARLVIQVPKVKFFLTGRPEPCIREGFRLPLLVDATDTFVLHEVHPNQINSDIQQFLEKTFSEITSRHTGLDSWPTKEQLDLLCKRAAGLFVYAVATVKFINTRNYHPRKRLDVLLELPDSSVHEGKTKFNANTSLDSLYGSILREAFGVDGAEHDPKVCSVLGAVVLAANPLSPFAIAMLFGIDLEDNMCQLPEAVANSNIHDLQERADKNISQALQYACRSWHKHLVNEPTANRHEITSALCCFLEKNSCSGWKCLVSLVWEEAVDALKVVAEWLEDDITS